MGCISSVPQENQPSNNMESQQPSNLSSNPSSNFHSSNIASSPIHAQQDAYRPSDHPSNVINELPVQGSSRPELTNWNTGDFLSYICTIENGKFCASQYDAFKSNVQALGINGQTMNSLCQDATYLQALGLSDEADIFSLQTAFVELQSHHNQNTNEQKENKSRSSSDSLAICQDDNKTEIEYFPSTWKFAVIENEKVKNPYYVGQRLLITNKYLHAMPSKCIYVENNWIVIRYDKKEVIPASISNVNELSLSNDSNNSTLSTSVNVMKVYKNMEKLHVNKDKARIQKIQYKEDKENNSGNAHHPNNSDSNIFEKEYYGMSYQQSSASNSLVGVVIPDCYLDPFTYEIMQKPVTSKISGRNYDEHFILQWLQNQDDPVDPITQQPMTKNDLYENVDLKLAIQRFLKNNPKCVTLN